MNWSLSDQNLNRFFFQLKVHKTIDELLDFLPKETIPIEYGGSGGTVAEIIGVYPLIFYYWILIESTMHKFAFGARVLILNISIVKDCDS